eukprot:1227595-Prymnesium_polylepis.1
MAHWELIERPEQQHEAGLLPAVWPCFAAVLFVDISGFTNLCTRLNVDSLQRHINSYFTKLTNLIMRNGGDVLRFAGDAIFCAWALKSESTTTNHAIVASAACATAMELMSSCGQYHIPEVDATLRIHCGIGASHIHCFRVGTGDRSEFLVAGDALQQAATAEGQARKGETICSPEAWTLVKKNCRGEARDDGCMLLQECSMLPTLAKEELGIELFTGGLLVLQSRSQSMHELTKVHRNALLSYVHVTARRAILADQLSLVSELRSVVV